jgi:hypothetical protein
MASRIKRTLWNLIPSFFSERVLRRWWGRLINELEGSLTDKFLELLLDGMDLAFILFKDFRSNIENFRGQYVFRTADNVVAKSATFADGNMQVHETAVEDWDARITFKDAAALRRFLFTRNQDILNSILANEVETDGNLNYIAKFAFMAKDLERRLGLA